MSNEADVWPDNTETEDHQDQQQKGPSAKDLRDQLAQANAKTAATERENAFLKAGISTESPMGKVFAKGYDGEVTSEAIKAAWAELVPETPDDGPTAAEIQAANNRQSLASTGSAAPPLDGNPDPYESAEREFEKQLGNRRSREDAGAAGFKVLREAAEAGDQRVRGNRP